MSAEKPTILLVEDDTNLGFVIKDNLQEAGYKVTLAEDGHTGYQKFHQQPYDLCLLDVMLPKQDGFSLAEDIRKSNDEVPIVFLTAKTMAEDKIKGLRLGADDYMTKPFNIEELILRIENILKRSHYTPDKAEKDVFQIGKYTFDYKNLQLSIGDSSKNLTKKEAELLRLMCINMGNVLEREMALKIVWGDNDYFLGRSMDVFVSKLRKYLKEDPAIKIENLHGIGFKLLVEQ